MQSDKFAHFGVIGGGVFFTVMGLANPFFTLYAAELGASELSIGLMVTLKALLPIFIAMPVGQLIDSVGPMRMLQYGSWILLASLLCMVFADGLALLAASQVLLGACVIVMASSFQVLVAKGDKDSRNTAIKKYSMWMSGGTMLGPLLGGLIASQYAAPVDGYHMAFVASTMVTGIFMAVLAWISQSYPHPKVGEIEVSPADVFSPKGVITSYKSGIGLARLRPVQFGLTATFLVMFIQSLYLSFLPLYLSQNGYATMLIATVVSIKGFAGMMSRLLLDVLMRRYTLESILTTAGTVAAVCVVITPLAVQSPVTMILVALVLGGAVGVNLPVSIMIMVEAVGDGQRGKLMGLRLLSNRFSQIISPAMFGLLGTLFGLTSAFYSSGVVLVVVVAGFATWSRRTWKLNTWGKTREPAE